MTGANKDYDKALKINPKSMNARLMKTLIDNKLKKAEECYKALLPLDTVVAKEMKAIIDKAKSSP